MNSIQHANLKKKLNKVIKLSLFWQNLFTCVFADIKQCEEGQRCGEDQTCVDQHGYYECQCDTRWFTKDLDGECIGKYYCVSVIPDGSLRIWMGNVLVSVTVSV